MKFNNKFKYILFSLFILADVYACPPPFEESDLYKTIHRDILPYKQVDPVFAGKYLSEVKHLYENNNVEVHPDIGYIFVLSGRSSYLKEPVDSLDVKDLEDDYHRIELGIKIAREVTAKRSNNKEITVDDIQKFGPIIIYNGRQKHNEDLRKALKEEKLTHYPQNKFRIFELNPNELNTKGQFISLKENLRILNGCVAIVTHTYHFPRVARMIGSKWDPFGAGTKKFFFLVDRELQAPGVEENIIGEIRKIPIYIKREI